ncbi:MAG: hypothetical protein QOH06_2177 [Acidobacteriota bacterium]|nr:hypothetical protein [Acidobacteriota bacterium]
MSWQTDLREIISGYFADSSIEEGTLDIVLISECDPIFHQMILTTFQSAIEAASRGEQEIVNLLRGNLILHVDSPDKAGDFLNRVLTIYKDQYSLSTGEKLG